MPGRWVNAGELRVGDAVFLRTRGEVTVAAVESRPGPIVVYNLTIADLHCYAVGAGELLVHNDCLESVDAAAKAKAAAQVAVNRAGHEAAVAHFIAQVEASGLNIAGTNVAVRTPFGTRIYDVVLRHPTTRAVTAVEIKSTRRAFSRFDQAAHQQFAADRWVNTYGADVVGKFKSSIGSIENAIKIYWPVP